jgi:hypothetical protein
MEMLFDDHDPSRLEAIESPLLERFSRSDGLLVLNDEAHHVGDEPAHAQFEQRARDRAKLTPEDAEPLVEAMAWIRSLRGLNGSSTAAGRLALQVDLSATLYAEAGATRKQAAKGESPALAFKPFDLFRHTVVRYDLKDAIPDGIVKKPILERVVVKNATTGELEPLERKGQPNAWEKYKNILVTGIERWKKVRLQLEDEGDERKPILFILCDNRNEAREVANYLRYGDPAPVEMSSERTPTGYRDPRDAEGAEPLFLFKDADGNVHSTVLEIHIGEKENRSESDWERVRNAVNAIDHDAIPDPTGRRESDGRPAMIPNPYNVVVSVMMLKEGWDVRNVKVIVPLRPCDSRTLTEQTLGRGLRKMHAPILDDEGVATLTNEELYVIEHPSFKAVLDQIRDILEEGSGEDPPREYVPILQREDPAEREAFDVRLLRFEGLTQKVIDWRKTFDVNKLPALAPRVAWQGEIADTEIQTFLKRALEQQEEAGQTFTLEGAPSYRDFDQVIELAYAIPLLKELRTSFQHKNAVKEVVREFLERKTFALPAGIPLHFGGIMEPDAARIALGNLARPDVITGTAKALLPALRKAIVAERSASQAQLSERRAAEIRNYQALKRNVVQALRRSSFQQAAVANADELAFAVLVDRARDVTGWLYNDRSGVGFSIPYDWQGRTSQYFPDFIVRAKLGEVFHNFIVEVKGRLDDRDRAKARAGEAYCELLTEHDREPWHYLMLIENKPVGREDVDWWQQQSSTEIGDLLRRHERLPLLPDAGGPPSGRPFQLLDARPSAGHREAVPVYDLAVAAGAFGSSQSPEERGWALVKTRRTLDATTMFVAQVVGKSMENGVPDGSFCLFRRFEAGAAPNGIALDGRRVVVELREGAESDLGGRYTLKRWHVAKLDGEGVAEVELRPDNREYRTIHMRRSDGEIRVVAELLEVLA